MPLGGYEPLFLLLTALSLTAALIAPWTATHAVRHREGKN
ncbi:MFS transporter OS=Streptomyces microflavus OX=1919 GN=Smic_09470 PE=4 SV=1 [Streptomyces microflavus]